MNSKDELKILQRIQRVEAPKDLYDKILLNVNPTQKVSWSLSLAASIAFFFLAATNIWFVNQQLNVQQDAETTENSYFESVISNTSNQLYHD